MFDGQTDTWHLMDGKVKEDAMKKWNVISTSESKIIKEWFWN